MKKNIWIDTDPGIDDALALIWAIQQEESLQWKIQGISTVKGNLSLAQINGNMCALLKHLNRVDIPLYEGAIQGLVQEVSDASYVHGTALGPFEVAPKEHISDKKAPEALAQILKTLKNPLTLVTLGPLTNIAIFLRLYPELIPKIEHIYMMGGGTYGNVSHYAEFNIHIDPEAAKIVFDSGIPITMSGLDISDKYAYIYAEELPHYLSLAKNTWTKALMEFFLSFYKNFEVKKIALYDPTVMVAVAYPDLFKKYLSPVTVELQGQARGMTLIPRRPTFETPLPEHISTQVLESCSREDFLQKLFEGL